MLQRRLHFPPPVNASALQLSSKTLHVGKLDACGDLSGCIVWRRNGETSVSHHGTKLNLVRIVDIGDEGDTGSSSTHGLTLRC